MRLTAAIATGITFALALGTLINAFPSRAKLRPVEEVGRRQQWLIQAGLNVTTAQFVLGSLLAATVAFGIFLVLSGVWVVALIPAVFVGSMPIAYFSRVRQRRLADVARAWPDGLRDLVASISSGASLQRAIEQMTETGPAPLRAAFGRFPFLARTIGVESALEVIKEQLSDPTSDRVIEVLILAHERGGPVVPDILRELAIAATRDVWTIEEIETQALEQKINSRAVFALPWLVLIAITFQDGAFRQFYTTSAGTVVVLAGAVMSGFGMWLVSRLGREPAEPRVFGGIQEGESL